MIKTFYLVLVLLFVGNQTVSAQLSNLNLKNALIVGLLDKAEDRYTVEINLSELFANNGVKTMASLNSLKQGADLKLLASDSIQNMLKEKGIDTYVLVSVRGYDRKFKPSNKHETLLNELAAGHSFPLYRDEITSISFEFNFYRNGQWVAYDLVKVGGVGSRDKVIKKTRKKLEKRLNKMWK